jgi:hypothetical protein
MEAAVRPISHSRHVAVLYGIEMDVVDVTIEICIITDCVLPIAALPNALFTL